MLAQKELPAYLREITSYLHLAISRFARLDAPVIAAVQGSAAGGGFSLAISCDLVIAAESANFLMAYSKIGMAPDGGSTYFLPRLVGLKRAMELTLTNRVLSAREACEWGIVTEVVPHGKSRVACGRAGAIIWRKGRQAHLDRPSACCMADGTRHWKRRWNWKAAPSPKAGGTADGQEGIRAFVEKRKAKFAGK